MKIKELITKKTINRTEYLSLLVIFVIFWFFLMLFVSIIVGILDIKNIKDYYYILLFLCLVYIVFIWYKRYKDIINNMNFFFIYILWIIMLVFWRKYIWIYILLWFIPILVLIFYPWRDIQFVEIKKEKILFYKNYHYSFRRLFTFRLLVVSLFCYFLFIAFIDDYLYNLNNYWKDPILISNNINLINETYVKLNVKWLKFKTLDRWLFETLVNEVKLKNGEKAVEKDYYKEIFTYSFDFWKLIIYTEGYEQTRKILDNKIDFIYWKLKKTNVWYSLYTWGNNIPEKTWFLYLLYFFWVIFLYWYIVFKDVAILKSKNIDKEKYQKFIKEDYTTILKNINIGKEHDVWKYILVAKTAKRSFNGYKSNVYFLKDINYDDINIRETYNFSFKTSIINIKEANIEDFFRSETNNIILLFSYIFKKIFWDDDIKIYHENDNVISQFESIITLEKWEKYIKKMKKESEDIYKILKKMNIKKMNIKEIQFELIKKELIILLFYQIILNRFINKEKNINYFLI